MNFSGAAVEENREGVELIVQLMGSTGSGGPGWEWSVGVLGESSLAGTHNVSFVQLVNDGVTAVAQHNQGNALDRRSKKRGRGVEKRDSAFSAQGQRGQQQHAEDSNAHRHEWPARRSRSCATRSSARVNQRIS